MPTDVELEEMATDERDTQLIDLEQDAIRRAQDEYAAELAAEYERIM